MERKLEAWWSPAQISGWLAEQYPNDPEMRVSHETIYQSLFVQSRGALRKELHACLRTGRAMRRAKAYTKRSVGQGQLRDMVMISERPAEVADRAVPGHWEGDLIFGKKMTSIGTLVERHSRYVILLKLPHGHSAAAVRHTEAEEAVLGSVRLKVSARGGTQSQYAGYRSRSVAACEGVGNLPNHVPVVVLRTGALWFSCRWMSSEGTGSQENTRISGRRPTRFGGHGSSRAPASAP